MRGILYIPLLATTIIASCISVSKGDNNEPPRIKVMIIDTGIHPRPEIKSYLSSTNSKADLLDFHGHGTNIAGLILYGRDLNDPVCKEVEIFSCKYYLPRIHAPVNCFKFAKSEGIEIVNWSGGGVDYDSDEESEVASFNGLVVAAAGNEGSDMTKQPYYPASLKNVLAIGNGKDAANRAASSNYGKAGMLWRDGKNVISFSNADKGYTQMTGTSQAAALATHDLLKAKCHRFDSAK